MYVFVLQMNLRGSGIRAAQVGQFGDQALEAIVEALILSLEKNRDLTKRVSIVQKRVETCCESRARSPP